MCKNRQERIKRRLKAFMLTAASFIICLAALKADTSYSASGAPHQGVASRESLDLRNLPDPFSSYLVREGKRASIEWERERRKRLEAENKFKRKKIAAAERLRELQEPKTELQKLNIGQLTLTAIICTETEAWAMVRDERGMGYILKKGTFIGTKGGSVNRIVREIVKTPYGNEYVRTVIIKEPYLENEVKIRYKTTELTMSDPSYE